MLIRNFWVEENMKYILMAKRSIVRKVGHCLRSFQAPRKNAQRPTVKAHPKSPEVPDTQLCSSCSCFAHDRGQRIGELVTVHIKSYDEMKRADCLICSILCEGLEQYSEKDSCPMGISLQVQEGIVQLHIGWEHPDILELFTNAGTSFVLILNYSGII